MAEHTGPPLRPTAALPPAAQRRSPLAIIERWRHPAGAGTGLLKMETHAFAAALAAHGRGIGVPVLDEEYLRHCLRAIDRLP